MDPQGNGVLVVGMARSGTSAVAGMFVSAGFYAGRNGDLMGPHESNQTGHFENVRVWRLNETILGALRGSWLAPPGQLQQIAARGWATPKLRALFAQLVDEADGAPVVLKDPRIGVMLPLWEPVIGDSLHPVLVIRDPGEIALSLEQRDGTPVPLGLAAWEIHMTTLLGALAGRGATVVPYRELLETPALATETVAAACARLDDGCAARVVVGTAGVALDPSLRRNRVRDIDHEELLTVRQQKLWRFLASLAAGAQTIEAPRELVSASAAATSSVGAECERQRVQRQLHVHARRLAEVAAVYDEASQRWTRERQGLHQERDTFTRERGLLIRQQQELTRHQHELRLQREQLTRERQDLAQRLATAHADADSLRSELARQRMRAEFAEGVVDAVVRTRSWTMTAPLRAGAGKLRAVARVRRGRPAKPEIDLLGATHPRSDPGHAAG